MQHSKWGWKNLKNPVLLEVLNKIRDYESRLWNEIHQDTKRDHPVKINDLTKEARERLSELGYDDFKELYRIRLTGQQRIWGILSGYIFQILWWDPNHEVCPSHKRYT